MKPFEDSSDLGFEMNVTPMIAIVVLSNILFHTTTASIKLQQDLSIDLPKQGKRLKTKTPPAGPVVVNVRHLPGGKASYHVENQRMSLSALTQNLSRAKVRNREQAGVSRGDRNVKWEHVAAVMGRCGQVGITKVSATVEITEHR